MKVIKKITKYLFIISIYVIWLFGLKMILPASSDNIDSPNQYNIVYTNKT